MGRRIRDGESVVLVHLNSEFALTFKWGDGRDINNTPKDSTDANDPNNPEELICEQDAALRMVAASRGHGIELRSPPRRGGTWILEAPRARPPKLQRQVSNSHILRYSGVAEEDVRDSWTLECTFDDVASPGICVVGWGPGGSCAVRRRSVTFAMWDECGGGSVDVLETGEMAVQSDGGGGGGDGEGEEGLMAAVEVAGIEGGDVTCTVRGEKISAG